MSPEKEYALELLVERANDIATIAGDSINKGNHVVKLKARAGALVVAPFMQWLAEELQVTDHTLDRDEEVFLLASEVLAMCLNQLKAVTISPRVKHDIDISFILRVLGNQPLVVRKRPK